MANASFFKKCVKLVPYLRYSPLPRDFDFYLYVVSVPVGICYLVVRPCWTYRPPLLEKPSQDNIGRWFNQKDGPDEKGHGLLYTNRGPFFNSRHLGQVFCSHFARSFSGLKLLPCL